MDTIIETLALYAGTDTEFKLRIDRDGNYAAVMRVDGTIYLGIGWKASIAIEQVERRLLSVLA